ETCWNDIHHPSSLLLSQSEIPSCPKAFFNHNLTHPLQTPIFVNEFLSEGTMGNITATIPLDISIKLWIVENITLGFRVLLMGSGFTPTFLHNFMTSLLSHMRKCLVFIQILWCMKYLRILMQSMFINGFVLCILERLRL